MHSFAEVRSHLGQKRILLCTEPKSGQVDCKTVRVIRRSILRESDHVGTDQQNRVVH